ncbi:hypothetical protein [Ottowia sp.]|uniref:hypothetical protein n=1 Tax=Ottowia sp. TaxID=1898956 RepID=UPI0025DFF721|nr:hypothetical protein [Ottowia sp.]
MSRLIADLQKVVGFPLFQKSGRTIKPTDEALVLMTKVQQSFIGLEEITSFSAQLQEAEDRQVFRSARSRPLATRSCRRSSSTCARSSPTW